MAIRQKRAVPGEGFLTGADAERMELLEAKALLKAIRTELTTRLNMIGLGKTETDPDVLLAKTLLSWMK